MNHHTIRVGVTGGGLLASRLTEELAAQGCEVIVHGSRSQLRAVHLRMLASIASKPRSVFSQRQLTVESLCLVNYTDDCEDLSDCSKVFHATDDRHDLVEAEFNDFIASNTRAVSQ